MLSAITAVNFDLGKDFTKDTGRWALLKIFIVSCYANEVPAGVSIHQRIVSCLKNISLLL